jgi:phosphomannomutase
VILTYYISFFKGLAKYLLKKISDAKERGVVIGFDARHNSER